MSFTHFHFNLLKLSPICHRSTPCVIVYLFDMSFGDWFKKVSLDGKVVLMIHKFDMDLDWWVFMVNLRRTLSYSPVPWVSTLICFLDAQKSFSSSSLLSCGVGVIVVHFAFIGWNFISCFWLGPFALYHFCTKTAEYVAWETCAQWPSRSKFELSWVPNFPNRSLSIPILIKSHPLAIHHSLS